MPVAAEVSPSAVEPAAALLVPTEAQLSQCRGVAEYVRLLRPEAGAAELASLASRPGKGRALVARRDTADGARLFSERPLHVVACEAGNRVGGTMDFALEALQPEHAHSLRVLLDMCGRAGMADYFDEWTVEAVVGERCAHLDAAGAKDWLNALAGVWCCNALELEGASSAASANTDQDGGEDAADDNENGEDENDDDDGGDSEDGDNHDSGSDYGGGGDGSSSTCAVLPMVACMNHSCAPSCLYEWDPAARAVHVLAARALAAGDELCLSYLQAEELARPAVARRVLLQERFGFLCGCERCAAEEAAVAAAATADGAPAGGRKRARAVRD